MNHLSDPRYPDPRGEPASQQRRPSAEALVASTLALMTGHAQDCCPPHRLMMSTKVAGNLRELARHPDISNGFQAMAVNLQILWEQLLRDALTRTQPAPRQSEPAPPGQAAPPPKTVQPASDSLPSSSLSSPHVLWHTNPETLQ